VLSIPFPNSLTITSKLQLRLSAVTDPPVTYVLHLETVPAKESFTKLKNKANIKANKTNGENIL